jgi:hypothetical protein
MSKAKRLEESFIFRVIHEMASTLVYLESEKVIHFDIKPQNIVVNGDPSSPGSVTVKLIDFGIAERGEEHDPKQKVKMAGGTAAYASPELTEGELDVGAPTDIWSLGVTLFYMTNPSAGRFRPELLWHDGRPQIEGRSEELAILCVKMLKRDPVDRITAGEILAELERLSGRSVTPVPALPAVPPAPTRKRVRFLIHDPGEAEPVTLLLPADATVKDLITKANGYGITGDRAKAQGYIVGEDDELADFDGAVFTVAGHKSLVPGTTPAKLVDIVFVIDGTGSMEEAISAVRDYIASIAIGIRMCDRRARIQYACVVYRDPVDSPSDQHEFCSFEKNPLKIKDFLNTMEATGGGDGEEDFVGAAKIVCDLPWRLNSRKSVCWIADSSAHGKFYGSRRNHQDQEPLLGPLITELAQREIRFIGLALNRDAVLTFRRFGDIYNTANMSSLFRIVESWNPHGAAIPIDADGIGRTVATAVLGVAADMLRDALQS